jgi:hypothetical protein
MIYCLAQPYLGVEIGDINEQTINLIIDSNDKKGVRMHK